MLCVFPLLGDSAPGRLWVLILETGDSSVRPRRTQTSLVFVFYLDESLQPSATKQMNTWCVFLNSCN